MEVMQSAVRLPSPEPETSTASRKRPLSPAERSPSPKRHRSPPRRGRDRSQSRSRSPLRRGRDRSNSRSRSPPRRDGPSQPLPRDVDQQRAFERARQLELRFQQNKRDEKSEKPLTAEQKQELAKAEYQKLLNARSGGVYVPPARLRALQAQITDKKSKEFQRMAWEALKKSINGLVNKVNTSNIKHIVPELFAENLVRGRGLFCRSIMKAQAASLPFTPIYACTVGIVNSKLPQVGELLVNRLIVQFRKAIKRGDKAVCLSSTTFLAHLCNQQVVHEILIAQILLLLLNKPTDDSVEIAVGLTKEAGQHLEEFNPQIALAVFDQFRNILHESDIEKRSQYMIEVLFQVRKDKYKDNPAIKEELDLIEEEDQITHRISLDDEIEVQEGLNVFKFDAEYEEHEEAYKRLKAEILGEAEGSGDEDEYDSDESSEEEEEEQKALEIKDQSNTDLVNLRRTIYLTIKSSGGFEECCHKLMRINLPPGQESELPSMIIECASQERTFDAFYGRIGERFCKLNRLWMDLFEEQFVKYYETIHRYETNRLRIIAQFFGHLLSTDGIGWHVFSIVHINEEETTSSSRIFIKILFEELVASMGTPKMQERFKEDTLQPSLDGLFPKDPTNSKNTRFSINFFTAIGMGAVTEGMRQWLKDLPKPAPPPLPAPESDSGSDSASTYSSYSSRSRSYTPQSRKRGRSRSRSQSYSSRSRSQSDSRSRSPPRRGRRHSQSSSRSRSYSSSRSRSRSPYQKRRRSTSYSRSPSKSRSPTRGRRDRSASRLSRSPSRSRSPARRRQYSYSVSRSRSPPERRDRSVSYSRSPSPPTRSNGKTTANASRRDASLDRDRSPPRGAGKGSERRRANTSSVERSLSPARRETPPRRGRDAGRSSGAAGANAAPRREVRKERSLSPYSKRLAMTRQMG